MATWKQENIMLTKVGEQALANAEAGEGKITITKVIGSAFTQDDIYNVNSQTQISENITFSIVDKESLEYNVGTSIHIQAVNKNLTAKFRLNTVVVYATHDSIGSGAFPYMIAKAENADEINTPDVTPTTLNYSLTIVNTRGGLLNITLNPAGLVPMSTFVNAKKALEEKIGNDIEAHNNDPNAHNGLITNVSTKINTHNSDPNSHSLITKAIAGILGSTDWREEPVATLKDIKDKVGEGGIVAKKFGKTGFIKYANGFLVQWGKYKDTAEGDIRGAGNRNITVPLPLSFKNADYSVVISQISSSETHLDVLDWTEAVLEKKVTNSNFKAQIDDYATGLFYVCLGESI